MRVDFATFPKDGFRANLQNGGVNFTALAQKLSEKRVKCQGKIIGDLPHQCDRCGDEFILHVDENVEVLVSDGFAELSNEQLENIIEFFDGFIDFDEIFISELEAIKSDYFYCNKCTQGE